MRVHARLLAVVAVTLISMGIIKGENNQVSGTQVRPGLTVVINFAELSRLPVNSPQPSFKAVPFLTIREAEVPAAPAPIAGIPSAMDAIASPTAASPSPLITFEALPDSYAVGTTTSYIPPDTHGAVGLDKIMVVLNNNVAILNKATGARLSTVSLNTFWASTGATGCFDPKVIYDPYNNRWIFVTLSNAQTSSSSLCIGVSATSDPSGSWYLTRFTVGTATLWGDFPCIGFNRNWIAVSINMFTILGDSFSEGRCLVLNYPSALSGTFTGTLYTGISSGSGGFCLHPAVTYSSTQDTLFLVSHISSGSGIYIVSRVTGTPTSPTLAIGATQINGLGGWTAAGGESLPQAPEPSPGTGVRKIDAGDSYVRSRVVYRTGSIYYSQTIGLPAGGFTRTGVQWVRVLTNGTYQEGGRVQDPTATATNGGKWYAYSSVDVNAFGDILLGFSQFSSAQWPSAGYTFKARGDAAGTMRDPLIFKSGADYYEKDFASGLNRWGDFSATQTDPSDDYHFWTIQEYSQTRVGTGNGSGRWGTWWAKVEPIDPLPIQLASFRTTMISQNIVEVSWTTLTEENNYGFEVQKSAGSPWEYHTIPNSFVPGHGTTNVPQDYSFRDTTGDGGSWYYRLKQTDLDGTVHFYEGPAVDFPTGVSTEQLPATLALRQNYPNPFNPTTVISYQLPVVSNARLVVYDLLGREVAVLVDGKELAGIHEVKFDARDLASGVYLYRLHAGDFVQTREMVFLK